MEIFSFPKFQKSKNIQKLSINFFDLKLPTLGDVFLGNIFFLKIISLGEDVKKVKFLSVGRMAIKLISIFTV